MKLYVIGWSFWKPGYTHNATTLNKMNGGQMQKGQTAPFGK